MDGQERKVVQVNIIFDNTSNLYTIGIADKKVELTREEAINLQNQLTRILKETPILDFN